MRLNIAVSIRSSRWCAVKIYFALYFFAIWKKNSYLYFRATDSILCFSFFAMRAISIFSTSKVIFFSLQKFATNSRSPSDSLHRRAWSKCATIIFCTLWWCKTKSKSTILSTPPLTARMIVCSGSIYQENVSKNHCILTKRFIFFSDKLDHFVIWSEDIYHFFPTFLTFLADHFPLPFTIIYTDRLHKTMTLRNPVSRILVIDMKWVEAVRAMIACWTRRMFLDHLSTVKTGERLISHDKTHRGIIYLLSRKRKVLLFCKKTLFLVW